MESDRSDPLEKAAALYREPLDPDKTRDIGKLLKQTAAEQKAFEAVVTLCDYLNRWNGAGKMDVAAARKEIAAALAINPRLGMAHYANGFLRRSEGKHHEALESFEKARKIEPGNPRFVAQTGAEYLYVGRIEEAVALAREAIALGGEKYPAVGMFRWIWARALFFDGKYTEAIPLLEKASREWPGSWYIHAYLASAQAHDKGKAEAARYLENFLRLFPDLSTVSRIVEAEQTNPNTNPVVVKGRHQFHIGLAEAGLPP